MGTHLFGSPYTAQEPGSQLWCHVACSSLKIEQALCERPLTLHRQQPEKHKQNLDGKILLQFRYSPKGKKISLQLEKFRYSFVYSPKNFVTVSLQPQEKFRYSPKGAWGYSNKSFPITAVRNTADQSFSKFRLLKRFTDQLWLMKG